MTDTLIRAAKTAVAVALSQPLVLTFTEADIDFLQASALTGAAAGITFLWNAALTWSQQP